MNIKKIEPYVEGYHIHSEEQNQTVLESKAIPLIPMRGTSVFPGMVIHFDIGRTKSINAIEAAMTRDQIILLSEQKDIKEENPNPEEVYEVGCVAKIKQMLKMPENVIRVLVEIKERAEIVEYTQYEPFFEIIYSPITATYIETAETKALIRMVKSALQKYLTYNRKSSSDIMNLLEIVDNPDQMIDVVCSNLMIDGKDAQKILQERNIEKRLLATYEVIVSEIEMIKIEQQIEEKVRAELDKNQRDYVLREQIKIIQDELGEEDTVDQIEDYEKRLAALDVSQEVRSKVHNEINRLRKVPAGSAESGVIESYIEWILDLPWKVYTEETVDVAKARKILDKDHYALESVKERILEYISVLKLADNLKSPIICLVGPPGVGKTSIAKSIAEALGRKYIRMSLGGMRDEAEIRGHRRTYVGAIPGRIIYHIKQAESSNPLFLLDEVDKLSQDFRGDPASALLEVLDPEQNGTFTDNYLELPFDLSKVLFLTTANTVATIPRPLLDRMEVIEVNGYVESEKLEIAKRYLIPKQREIHGLNEDNFKISQNALESIISYHTRESGVRELDRKIARVARVAAKEIVEFDKDGVFITQRNINKYLGKNKYHFDLATDEKVVGLVNGLAWTAVGGETLQIEVVVVRGKGKVEITGQLGEIMQESVKAAISYIRSQYDCLGIPEDFYEKKDIHVHVPEGAVPKDGPSAGITMTTALISALTKKGVSQNLAMTGEITLSGRVLPIGGLREKLTAAHRAGIRKVCIPKDNDKDLEDVPDIILKDLEIVQVSRMDEVVNTVFGDILCS